VSAPWPAFVGPGVALGVGGAVGLAYAVVIVRQALRQTDYALVLEDWIWHFTLPPIAYAALLMAAVFLDRSPTPSLFTIGGAALLLLFIGIHNSWDSVVYIALRRRSQQQQEAEAQNQEPEAQDLEREAHG
jgi:hypothetical protein